MHVVRGGGDGGAVQGALVGQRFQRGLVGAAHRERFTIDEQVFAAIQHQRLARQLDAFLDGAVVEFTQQQWLGRAGEEHIVLGLGQVFAQEDGDVLLGETHLVQFLGDGAQHVARDFRWLAARFQCRIGIAARQVDRVGHEL